ncbi:MAG: PaaI family thioesterase [Desulfarculaceae bacterium]|nr:PaaI family thioesterase [Desulfarculaceae bacterium]MCF8073845.1 PaaI family thioesterase [Desulfarculaceae bacterium]MCF8102825.1 PaaI family thioesterase [Desulfarculaceae bacterium]MCF8116269.1 PaaI family thioesterase [Desulfarculaceae bacterium]
MRQLNPEHFERLVPLLNQAPFFRKLKMRVTELGWSYALVELDLDEEHNNLFGGTHGGTYTAMIDTAAYWSAYCQMDEQTSFITVDVGASMMGAPQGNKLVARGECLKMGRTMGLTEATVKDLGGRIIAHGNSKVVAIPVMNTIDQLLTTLGSEPLPPKYLD